MRRRWFGVIIALYASLSSVLFYAPAVQASCIQSSTIGCTTLTVQLSAPVNGATVTLTRQSGTSLPDSNVTLTRVDDTHYRSDTIFGTQPDSDNPNCIANPIPDSAYFDVSVKENGTSVVGTATRVNLCGGGQRSINVQVSSSTSTSTMGGIIGNFSIKTPSGEVIPCPSTNNNLQISGPTTKQVPIGVVGQADSGLTLTPGTYNVELNCLHNNDNPVRFTINNVVVTAGKLTALGTVCQDSSGTPCTGTANTQEESSGTVDCDAGLAFTWLICGAIRLIVITVDTIRDKVIVPTLKEPPLDKDSNDYKAAYAVWTAFRDVAAVVFILLFMILIFGTAMGLDNYTVKKALPHLVAGAILMPLSWYICAAVIDLGNVLGQGMVNLVNTALATALPTSANGASICIDLTSNFTKIFLGGAAAGAVAIALFGATASIGLGLLITMLLAFASAFVTLIFRKILIIILVVISPLAIAAWILPNTEKYAKKWWENLIKVVMMYPIIILLFMAGRLFAATACAAPATGDFLTPVLEIVGLILPMFAIPWAGQMAGAGYNMGAKGIDKARKWGDSRVGQNSDIAKTWKQNREAKNLAREKKFGDQAKASNTVFGKRLNQARAFRASTRNGAPTWFRGGAGKLAKEEAQGKALERAGKLQGMASKEQPPGETAAERIEAEKNKYLDAKGSGRAERAALNDAVTTGGGIGSYTATKYNADRSQKAKSLVEDLGKKRTYNANERVNGNSLADVMASAEAGAVPSVAKASGDVRATLRQAAVADVAAGGVAGAAVGRTNRLRAYAAHATETTANALGDAEAKLGEVEAVADMDAAAVASGAAPSIEAAARARLSQRTIGAANAARVARGEEQGAIDERYKQTMIRPRESTENARAAGSLAAREKLNAERSMREKRVAVQNTAEGHVSDAEAIASADMEAEERLATAAGSTLENLAADRELVGAAAAAGVSTTSMRVAGARAKAVEGAGTKTAAALAGGKAYYKREADLRAGRTPQAGSLPSARQAVTAARIGAESAQSKRDRSLMTTSEALEEQVTRQITENNGNTADPALREQTRAKILDTVGEAAASDNKGNWRETFNKAAGSLRGEDEGAEAQRIEMEADAIHAAEAGNYMRQQAAAGKPVTFDKALAETRQRAVEQAKRNIASGTRAGGRGTPVTQQAAVDAFRDAKARDAYLVAAQVNAAGTTAAVAKQKAQAAASTALQAQSIMDAAKRTGNPMTMEQALKIAARNPSRNPTQDLIRTAATAAIDSSRRAEALSQGKLLAESSAFESPTKVSDAQLVNVARRDQEYALASKEAEQLARTKDTERDYGQTVNDIQRSQLEKIIQQRKDEAARIVMKQRITDKNGVTKDIEGPIGTIDMGPDTVQALKQEAIEAAQKGDVPRLIAATESMSRTGGGTEAIRELQVQLLGRTSSTNVDPSRADQTMLSAIRQQYGEDYDLRALNNMMIARVNRSSRPDVFIPENAAFDEMTPDKLKSLDKRTIAHYFEWLEATGGVKQQRGIKNGDRNLEEAVASMNVALARPEGRSNFEPNHYDAMRALIFKHRTEDVLDNNGQPVLDMYGNKKTKAVFVDDQGAPVTDSSKLVLKDATSGLSSDAAASLSQLTPTAIKAIREGFRI